MGHCKHWSGSDLSVQLTRPTGRDGSGIKTLFGAAGTALRHSPLTGLLRLNIFADVGPCKKQRGKGVYVSMNLWSQQTPVQCSIDRQLSFFH